MFKAAELLQAHGSRTRVPLAGAIDEEAVTEQMQTVAPVCPVHASMLGAQQLGLKAGSSSIFWSAGGRVWGMLHLNGWPLLAAGRRQRWAGRPCCACPTTRTACALSLLGCPCPALRQPAQSSVHETERDRPRGRRKAGDGGVKMLGPAALEQEEL